MNPKYQNLLPIINALSNLLSQGKSFVSDPLDYRFAPQGKTLREIGTDIRQNPSNYNVYSQMGQGRLDTGIQPLNQIQKIPAQMVGGFTQANTFASRGGVPEPQNLPEQVANTVGFGAGIINPLNPFNKGMGLLDRAGVGIAGKVVPKVASPVVKTVAPHVAGEVLQTGGITGAQAASGQQVTPETVISNALTGLGLRGAFGLGRNMVGKSNLVKQVSKTLRGTKNMTADDIMKTHPNIQLKRNVPATDMQGNKIQIPEGEKLTPYELKGNKVLLQDGDTYLVNKNQFQNIKGNSVEAVGKPFAPELEGLEEKVMGYRGQMRDVISGKDVIGERPPKYHQYTLPGGENYREILIKAPLNNYKEIPVGVKIVRDSAPYDNLYTVELPNGRKLSIRSDKPEELNTKILDGLNSQMVDYFESKVHWPGEKNPISHIRLNDRTYNGKKVTFMEELQSDWAREARDKGIRDDVKIQQTRQVHEEAKNKLRTFEEELKNKYGGRNIFGKDWNDVTSEDQIKLGRYQEAFNSTAVELNKLESGIPNHPLLKKWQELSIKRALKDAVDNDSDYFAWINGEQTSARYNLSTHVDKIEWKQNPNAVQKRIVVRPKDNRSPIEVYVNPDGKVANVAESTPRDWVGKKLDEVLGKGLADNIMSKNEGNLSGEGLKFGGEWANNLYDKQVKSIVEDLIGQKVETLDLGLTVKGTKKEEIFRMVSGDWGAILTPENMKVGQTVGKGLSEEYVITEVSGNGKFRAVPKDMIMTKNMHDNAIRQMGGSGGHKLPDGNYYFTRDTHQFDISQQPTLQQGIKLTPELKAKIRGEAPKIETSGKQFE